MVRNGSKLPEIDTSGETRRITAFIDDQVRISNAKGVVVGLSGGVDSAVVGALCVRALGRERVLALLMPSDSTPREDMDDAVALGRGWGVDTAEVPVSPLVRAALSSAKERGSKVADANVQVRLRMVLLYYFANNRQLLVAGTGDRSEELLGFFSKFGDGGVDFLPIAHLYKTQVRGLGRHLGLPERVVGKQASPRLWPGHTAAEELPADYDRLDPLLHYLFDKKLSAKEAAARAGTDVSVAMKAIEMHKVTEHKRKMPPSLSSI